MLDIAAEESKHRPFDEVIILGDFFDCYSVSRYDKDPEKNFLSLKEEIIEGQKLIRSLLRRVKSLKWTFLMGNHEARISHYLKTYASVLSNVMSTRDILGLPKSWEVLNYGKLHQCGNSKLYATHGSLHSVHVCAKTLASYGGISVIFGHVHKMQMFETQDVDGTVRRAVTCGWLGEQKEADYMKTIPLWQKGFAIGWFFPDGKQFDLDLIHIENNRAIYRGKVYKK